MDSGTVCNCIALGEEQLAWNEDIYFEGKLILPKGRVIDRYFIDSITDPKEQAFITTYSDHIKIAVSAISLED